MSKNRNMTDLQDALQKPVIASSQMKKMMTQSIASVSKTAEPRWYVSFMRTTLESFCLAIGGYAFAIVLVAIAHYTGLEAWIDSMRNQ